MTAMVNIIAKGLHEAATQIRLLDFEPAVFPILFKGNDLTHDHEIYKVTLPLPIGTPSTNNVVTNIRLLSDVRLACGEGAKAMKGIRSKPEVVRYNIRIEGHFSLITPIVGYILLGSFFT
jgi:hypothetical protein